MRNSHANRASAQEPKNGTLLQEHGDVDNKEGWVDQKLVHGDGVQFEREGVRRDNRRSSSIQIPGANTGIFRQ